MRNKKNKYSVDNKNRLVINDTVVNGSFSTDKNNRLIYRLNEPRAWRRKHGLPGKIIFIGNWSLNENHDLDFLVADRKDRLSLEGKIIAVESHKLVFAINQGPVSRICLLKLSGSWGCDEASRIFFSASKKPNPDILTFEGGWKLNGSQQIVYTYQKTDLKRKTKVLSELRFSGFWQITSANRLTYILSRGTNSGFDFKVQLETPNLYPQDGKIKYRLGAGVKGAVPKTICLYGTWKFSRRLGLVFEMEYAKGEIHSLVFGTEVDFGKNNQIAFNLKDRHGEELGISLIFTHKLLRQAGAEWFLRLKHTREGSGIDTGMRIPF